MKPRNQRMLAVGIILVGVSLAVALATQAFQENLLYFYSPSEVLAGEPPADRRFRVGGLVEADSVQRQDGVLEVEFRVTDMEQSLKVYYDGVLPDLFREGQGVIAHGNLQADGSFRADQVLAKHDENYMPPEVAETLAKHGHPVDTAGQPN